MTRLIKKSSLEKAVREYNKYHGAEAHVRVLKQHLSSKGHLLAEFKGPFCFSCAQDEYYVDFQILLEEITGLKFKLGSVKQGENGVIVDFEYDKKKPAIVYFLHF
jgi:hypothetical protein